MDLKVFFIGFNKSGTTTYHNIMSQKFKSKHNTEWAKRSRDNRKGYAYRLKQYFKSADSWSDGESPDYKRLDEVFPNAKFILNTRCERSWLISLVRHVHRPAALQLKGQHYREFFVQGAGREQSVISMWLKRRRAYHRSVYKYFGNQTTSKFTVLDIENDDVVARLSNFLGVQLNKSKRNMHYNRAVVNENFIIKYVDMIDNVLANA